MTCIQDHLTNVVKATGHAYPAQPNSLEQSMRELYFTIEQLYEDGKNIGTAEKFFSLVEANISLMPVSVCSIFEVSCPLGGIDGQ